MRQTPKAFGVAPRFLIGPTQLSLTIILLFVAYSPAAEPVHTHGMDLSKSERLALEGKAAKGDAKAAMRLWLYHALERHDGAAGERWLCRAAELGDPKAQWNLGYSIKELNPPNAPFPACSRQFGKNRKAIVKTLLEAASRSEGGACYELASAYEDGYFGGKDGVKARDYLIRGAHLNDRLCWEKLADYYRRGLGGPQDEAEAYYWISLEALCVDPGMLSGRQIWNDREEIAQRLSLPILERQWQRIDDFMARVAANEVTIDSQPLIDPKLEAEGRRASKEREEEHRNRLKSQRPDQARRRAPHASTRFLR